MMDKGRIRVRAYFHFENRTGHNWLDSVSNWLQAEHEEQGLIFFVELGRRVDFIRNVYARYHIALKPNEGLTHGLAETESLGKGEKASFPYSRGYHIQLTNEAHVMYAFGGDLENVVNAGLDVSHHLANLTTCTTDYGTPSTFNSMIFSRIESSNCS